MNGNAAKDLVGRPKAEEWPSMKVLFPSLATVEASELGKDVSQLNWKRDIADISGWRNHVCRTELEDSHEALIP
jgi:hypothetical protein